MWPTVVLFLFFPCKNVCAENFVIFFCEIGLLFTYLLNRTIPARSVGAWKEKCWLLKIFLPACKWTRICAVISISMNHSSIFLGENYSKLIHKSLAELQDIGRLRFQITLFCKVFQQCCNRVARDTQTIHKKWDPKGILRYYLSMTHFRYFLQIGCNQLGPQAIALEPSLLFALRLGLSLDNLTHAPYRFIILK